jgi:hypothetical protein
MTFYIPDDVLTAHLDDETVLLNMATKRYFHLNGTGQSVWLLLESGSDVDAMTTHLCKEFDVDRETASAEVQLLLQEFVDFGVVRVEISSSGIV